MRLSLELLLHGRVGREYRVVLILAERALAFRRHDTDHLERLIADSDDLAGRINVWPEEVLGDDRAQDRDFGRAADVLLCEERPVFRRPAADRLEVDVSALNLAWTSSGCRR